MGLLSKAVPLAIGAGQLIAGRIQDKKADNSMMAPENVLERRTYNALQRELQSMKTRALGGSRGGAISKTMKNLGSNMFKSGGPINYGNIAKMYSSIATDFADQNQNAMLNYNKMLQEQATNMADLRNERSALMYTQAKAKAAKLKQSGNQMLGAGIANII